MSRSSIYYRVTHASGVRKLQILIAVDKVVQKAYLMTRKAVKGNIRTYEKRFSADYFCTYFAGGSCRLRNATRPPVNLNIHLHIDSSSSGNRNVVGPSHDSIYS